VALLLTTLPVRFTSAPLSVNGSVPALKVMRELVLAVKSLVLFGRSTPANTSASPLWERCRPSYRRSPEVVHAGAAVQVRAPDSVRTIQLLLGLKP